MLGDLGHHGYNIMQESEEVDCVIVNTCAFVEEAKAESLQVQSHATVHCAEKAPRPSRMILPTCGLAAGAHFFSIVCRQSWRLQSSRRMAE